MEWLDTLIGYSADSLNTLQMSIRGLICFAFAVVLIRIMGQRIFGKNTALDIIVSVILGSNISRAVTGNAPLFPTLITTVVIVLAHLGLTYTALQFPDISNHLKGRKTQLVRDGEPVEDAMLAMSIGPGDLEEAMRLQGLEPDITKISEAYIERNGDISIISD